MYYTDYHLHTMISEDSPAPLEAQAQAAIDAGVREFCVTDHWNLVNQRGQHLSRTWDWTPCLEQLERARAQFAGRVEIRLGIEVGNGELDPQAVDAALELPQLDFVIGSLHNMSAAAGGRGIFTVAHQCSAPEEGRALVDDYFQTLFDLVDSRGFDVLGHVVYPLRYLPAEWGITFAPYEDQLRELFRRLIQTGRGIEVNSSQGSTVEVWRPVLKLYRDCGGELITVGSDAHYPHQVAAAFRDLYALIESCGFRYQAVYRARKPQMLPLA